MGQQITPGSTVVYYRAFLAICVDFGGFQQPQLQVASTKPCVGWYWHGRHFWSGMLWSKPYLSIWLFCLSDYFFPLHVRLNQFNYCNDSKERCKDNEGDFRVRQRSGISFLFRSLFGWGLLSHCFLHFFLQIVLWNSGSYCLLKNIQFVIPYRITECQIMSWPLPYLEVW